MSKKPNLFDSDIRFAGVLGDPITHSLSPVIHNQAFQELKMDAFYLPIRVRQGDLGAIIKKLIKLPCLGINLTIPLKEKVFAFLDCVDEEAQKIGAINCVVMKGGKTFGYNTDAKAFGEALHQEGFLSRGKRALVFGAGGAARAVLYQMGVLGFRRVIVCNRHSKRARDLLGSLRGLFPDVEFSSLPWDQKKVSPTLSQTDLFVNATSIGVTDRQDRLPLQIDKIHEKSFFFDLNYGPSCMIGRGYPFRFCDGMEMFVRQAALSFSLWTGRPSPFKLMRKAVQESLSAKGQV